MKTDITHDSYLDTIRHKVTRNFCVFCFALALLAIPASFMARDRSTLIINTIGVFFYAVPLIVLWKTKQYRTAAAIFICIATAATMVNAVAANFDINLPTVVWYFVYLVFADLVLNVGWAVGIAAVGLVSVSLFAVLHLEGLNRLNQELVEESIIIGSPIALLVAFVALLYLLTIYKKLRDKILSNLVTTNMEKNQLIGAMSHDLRNYLGAITGVTSMIRYDLTTSAAKPTPEILTGNLDIIDRAASKALTLVEDVIGAVRDKAETGKNIYFEDLDLHDFIAPIFQRYQVLAQMKGVSFIKGAQSEHARVSINKVAFSRVIENLLSNALKFSRKGDTVTVATSLEPGFIVISVADTGIGIPEEIRGALFEQYTKAGRPGTAGETSIGLGLSIVKKLVELHNGTIRLESQEGKGTTFFIRLKGI
jgi:signal transduction histidine kinase